MDFNSTQQKKKSFLRRLMAGNLQPQEVNPVQANEDQVSPLDTEADSFSRQSLLRNQLANYNQKVPEVPKEKLGKKLLQYGGAGLLGAATGVGALPAVAMTGLFKHISKNKKQAANMEATSKRIEALSEADKADRILQNQDERISQMGKDDSLGWARLGFDKSKYEDDAYNEALSRVNTILSNRGDPNDADIDFIQRYRMKNKIPNTPLSAPAEKPKGNIFANFFK